MGNFQGFSKETLDFLFDLRSNNNKKWFEENRPTYTKELITPMRYLVSDLSDTLLEIDPLLDTTPAVGKTISRINRDIRFSKDKSPYRSNMWITFKRLIPEWKDSPCFYFELFPDWYRYGMGFYAASKHTMDKFREMLSEKSDEFKKVTSFLGKEGSYAVDGEKYKRLPCTNPNPDLIEWYYFKNFYLTCNRTIDAHIFSDSLVKDVSDGFKAMADFYHYLHKIRSLG